MITLNISEMIIASCLKGSNLDRAGLPTMWAKHKGVQPPLVSQVVQLDDVGVHVVDVVRVWRVLVVCPLVRSLRMIRLD